MILASGLYLLPDPFNPIPHNSPLNTKDVLLSWQYFNPFSKYPPFLDISTQASLTSTIFGIKLSLA